MIIFVDKGYYHYWIFLAVKAKIIFLVATFITIWVFVGKAFAFLYYTKNKGECVQKQTAQLAMLLISFSSVKSVSRYTNNTVT